MSAPKVLTGLDLPWGSPGGSVELLKDLYLGPRAPLAANAFMLGTDASTSGRDAAPASCEKGLPALLDVPGKQLSGEGFWSYVDGLTHAITTRFPPVEQDVLHLQHLAFGATPALLRGYPKHPGIALVHGTDLLFAEEFPTQHDVLHEAAAAARAIVVPSAAMADRLRMLTPAESDRIVHIPWGVPDYLLARPPARTASRDGDLRVLYAGRLTAEKGAAELVAAVSGAVGVQLSMAAPADEFRRLSKVMDLSTTRYLGWLSRPDLWTAFAEHDLLVIPSARLEAFGLVAIEAQACGLPVAYQPVPGLTDVLGDSALPLDLFADAGRTRDVLVRLTTDRSALEHLRAAGHRNAARFPLSRTADELAALTCQVR
ncbi:glycosyltransferase family 4 protein [Streptomyces sp. NBC_01431]|uniref:glycosyltransferase family 4 protein n=1 Tax=Streptomyces sp. NBC_01431 TaxID=2903863 RepID=UPI002E2F5896|nr:glycosyltransferase family 4 protein [Streptomyces sp. NBC_01431]